VLSVDALCDELWDGKPPETARAALQVHVAALRRALGPVARLVTRAPGYMLEVNDEAFDAQRFEHKLGAARSTPVVGGVDRGDQLRTALALWRGPALSEFTDLPSARAEAGRLNELRLTALEERMTLILPKAGTASSSPSSANW
jgi:SARP family transcriptional regulator, regulator of embCAB operon